MTSERQRDELFGLPGWFWLFLVAVPLSLGNCIRRDQVSEINARCKCAAPAEETP